jgi:hypothetical protein
MCGPLAGFACSRVGGPRPGTTALWRYQLGRLVSYGAVGALAGAIGGSAATLIAGRWGAALISWSLAAALAVAAIRSWQRSRPPRAGARASAVQSGPGTPSLFERVAERLPREPALFGAATALLPCGALAAAVGLAATAGTPLGGLVTMVAFAALSGRSRCSARRGSRGSSRVWTGARGRACWRWCSRWVRRCWWPGRCPRSSPATKRRRATTRCRHCPPPPSIRSADAARSRRPRFQPGDGS